MFCNFSEDNYSVLIGLITCVIVLVLIAFGVYQQMYCLNNKSVLTWARSWYCAVCVFTLYIRHSRAMYSLWCLNPFATMQLKTLVVITVWLTLYIKFYVICFDIVISLDHGSNTVKCNTSYKLSAGLWLNCWLQSVIVSSTNKPCCLFSL